MILDHRNQNRMKWSFGANFETIAPNASTS